MRVLYLGNFRPPHSTENDVAASLRTLGATVECYQEDDAIDNWPAFLTHVANIDLLLYTRTWGLPHHAQDLWKLCDRAGIVTAAYHLDLFFGLDREPMVANDPMFRMAHVFTADGDHEEEFAALDINHHYLRAGVKTKECRSYGNASKWKQYDVAFIGSSKRYHHNKWPNRSKVQARLKKDFGDKFLLAPNNNDPAIRGKQLNQLYSTIPVIVGDTLSRKYGKSLYWSDRVYETLGRGGFLLFPRIKALQEELEGIQAVDWYGFNDYDEMSSKAKSWAAKFRADPNLRKTLTTPTMKEIKKRCSYDVRVAEMLKVVGLR